MSFEGVEAEWRAMMLNRGLATMGMVCKYRLERLRGRRRQRCIQYVEEGLETCTTWIYESRTEYGILDP